MSDTAKTADETAAPAVEQTPAVEATETAKPSEVTAEPEPNGTTKPSEAEATATGGDAAPVPAKEETSQADKSEEVVEATPATEGTLGYKSSHIIPKFRFHEHYFWFSDEPSTAESLASYVRGRDLKSAHPNAAWAQETGKGLLFYAKGAEDKSSPAGIINLSDATLVSVDGIDEFFFRAQGQKHAFQVKSTAERSSWVVAIEKKIEQAKAMKDDIHGSEGYKKHLESFAKAPALAAVATSKHEASTSSEPKKSTDAAHATNGPTKDVVGGDGTNEEKKGKDAKSRSQSRKRSSIFGSLLGKKDEKEEQKEVKEEEQKEEKAEKKEEVKEDKEQEANATSEPSTAAEAGSAAAADAAVPAAAVVAEEKKHDKQETDATTTPTEKKPKRASIFGSLFSKKDATSPTTEKAEKDDGPSVPAKDAEVPPVSETAPKIEEPIANKPIDTAAVTAPIDTAQAPAAAEETSSETPKETAAAETATTPTKEKKSATTEEAKPADKRRSSLFGNLKKKTHNADSTADAEATEVGTKRERSPLPQRIGSLFRRPSRGVKSEEPKEAAAAASDSAPAAETTPAPVIKDESAATNGTATTETPAGDVVPDNLHSTIQDAVTAPEVKASA